MADLKEMIEARIKQLKKGKDRRDVNFYLLEETLGYRNIMIHDNEAYQFNGKAVDFKVNSLKSIGWPDPLPDRLPQKAPVAKQHGSSQPDTSFVTELKSPGLDWQELYDDPGVFIDPHEN